MLKDANEPSPGYVIAGIASFFVPGLGHLVLNRRVSAFIFFMVTCMAWPIGIGIFLSTPSDLPTLIGIPLGVATVLIPNITAAYYAANGHLTKKTV